MKSDFQGGSRFNYRTKRKKTNLILNSLIGVVLLLIVFVAYSIFFSGNDNKAAKKDIQTTAEKTNAEKTVTEKKQAAPKIEKDATSASEKSSADTQTKKKSEHDQKDQSATSDEKSSDQTQTVDSPDLNANNQASTTTTQHATSYDTNSQDWQEMLQTMSSATGIDQGNMTVWFLGSDRSTPNGSVGTISAKDDKTKKFKVYLQWQDGKGWTATNVEQIQ